MEEPKEAPKFNPTDTQIEVSKKLSSLLQTLSLFKTMIAVGDRDSVRFDIHFDKKKLILSVFIYPEGTIEIDLYSTKLVTEERPLNKDDLVESKCVMFSELQSDIVHYSDAARKLKK
jgi:hypothetical protein